MPAAARQVTEDLEAHRQRWAKGSPRWPPLTCPCRDLSALASPQGAGDSAGVRGPSLPRAVRGQHFEALRALVQPMKAACSAAQAQFCPVWPCALCYVTQPGAKSHRPPLLGGCGPGCPVLAWTAGLAAMPSQQGKAVTCVWRVDRREGASGSRHKWTLVPELHTCGACPGG